MNTSRGMIASLLLSCVLGGVGRAEAQTPEPVPAAAEPTAPAPVVAPPAPAPAVAPAPAAASEAVPLEPRRKWGLGSALGAGFAGAAIGSSFSSTTVGAVGFALLLPTFEMQFFLRRGHSIDISVPLLNIVAVSALARIFYFSTDAFYNFNVGRGSARFVVGPGLGLSLATYGGAVAGSLRIPAEVGVEFLTKGRGFGFKILGRPWVEVAFAGAAGTVAAGALGGGLMLAVAFTGYSTAAAAPSE